MTESPSASAWRWHGWTPTFISGRPVGLVLPLLLLLCVAVGAGQPAPGDGAAISGEILANREAKARHAARLAAAGKTVPGSEVLDWESVVLYVSEPLEKSDIAVLAADDVHVQTGMWVPPVPGRHPHGYYLARIRYDALHKAAAHPRTVRIDTAETPFFPQNDVSRQLIGVQTLHDGVTGGPFTGAGVIVAVADSGLDLNHEDIPEPIEAWDVRPGDDPGMWWPDVGNRVTGHGTHVSGTAAGRGTLSTGTYAGMAPDADLLFYKIGDDQDARTTEADIIKAVVRASSQGAHVFNLSYGGFGPYMDGSGPISQAMDAAFENGMISVVSAGNSANANRHYSATLPPGTDYGPISMTFRASSSGPVEEEIILRVIWRGGQAGTDTIALELLNPGEGDVFLLEAQDTSLRGTNSLRYHLEPGVEPGESRTYEFRLSSSATGGEAPLVHLYQGTTSRATFQNADPNYTVTRPGDTDTAVTVAAWVHRQQWVDWQGNTRGANQQQDTRATFSSIGPRIDGGLKPDITAPGSTTISARDNDISIPNSHMISNDGVNDGSGPANYSTSQGTSMAAPVVTGALALLWEAWPERSAADIRSAFLQSGNQADNPDKFLGHGLFDAALAVELLEPVQPDWLLIY